MKWGSSCYQDTTVQSASKHPFQTLSKIKMVNKMYTTKVISEIMCESLTEFYHSWMVSVSSAMARDDYASARTYTHKFNGQLNMILNIEHKLYDADMDFGFELYDLHHFYYKLSKRMIRHLLYL